jgi:hypothetical protein
MAKLSNAKSQFALDVAEQLAVVGKSVLVTHKLKPQIIKQIVTRPDLCASLGVLASNAKQYTKGAKALKASKDFRILGYVGYQNFVKKATLDVSKFQAKVAGDFNLANNSLVVVFQKDEATGDFEGDVQDLKSVAIPWEKAILPETKIPNAIYLVILFGQGWIRPKSEKFASVKLRVNLRKENKRTPAKIKAELKRKANKKLKRINSQLSGLKAASRQTAQRLQAFDKYGEVSRQEFLNSRALARQFGQRLQNPKQDVTQQDLKRYKSIVRKNSKIADGYKLASGVSNPQALRQRASSLEARIAKLLGRRQAINTKLNADLAAVGGQQLQIVDAPQQILVPQMPVQQVANPRVQKLMKRAQILNQRIANAQNSKVRGNANFELRKINKQLQALGVPSQVVNSQVVAPQLQVAPQLTAEAKRLQAKIAKILGRNQVLKQRVLSDDTKARGNAAFQLRKNAGKLRQLGYQVAPQAIQGTGFNTLGQRIRQILGSNQTAPAAQVAPAQVIQQVVPVQQIAPVKKTRGRKPKLQNVALDVNSRVDDLLAMV